MADTSPATLMRAARRAHAAGRYGPALDAVCRACELRPGDASAKRLAAVLFQEAPGLAGPEHAATILALVRDPAVEPQSVGAAGWSATLADVAEHASEPALADRLEHDALALALLEEAPVAWPDAERRLVRLRRWLLVARAWPRFPNLTAALVSQARLNGGAWWFDDEERALIATEDGAPLAEAYLPPRVGASPEAATAANGTSGAVRRQYERWPYPRWRRITTPPAERLPDVIARQDPDFRADVPLAADILVAGCGTGRHAALVASRFPDARVTAIDVSGPSLDYARCACAAIGVTNVTFARLDLLRVADLGRRFHAIYCAGVLHHLEDPEAGWSALAGVLRPGGAMRLSVYSRVARLSVAAARLSLADLAGLPLDDDLIRRARQRLLDAAGDPSAEWLARAGDFATLEGACDLLLHPHEDPFTVRRIGAALAATGMRLLSFHVGPPSLAREYAAMFPDDPGRRDLAHWSAFERRHPRVFAEMYRFWCGKPA